LKVSIIAISGRQGRVNAKMLCTKSNIQRKEGEKEGVLNRSWSWESKARFINIQGRARQRRHREKKGERRCRR
jgi:hypothetical protein